MNFGPMGSKPLMFRLLRNVPSFDGCWEWTGYKRRHGYGGIGYTGTLMSVHVLSYWIHKGPIPSGMCVLHSCDNPCCFNPEHLRLGTSRDNVDDMVAKKRHQHGVSHWHTVLTENQVLEIKQSTLSSHAQAKLHGVSRSCIQDIRKGRNWNHLQPTVSTDPRGVTLK